MTAIHVRRKMPKWARKKRERAIATMVQSQAKYKESTLAIIREFWPISDFNITELEAEIPKLRRNPVTGENDMQEWLRALVADVRRRLAAGEGPP